LESRTNQAFAAAGVTNLAVLPIWKVGKSHLSQETIVKAQETIVKAQETIAKTKETIVKA
jgi:hypothetical protein